jgi:hypothetical protein
MICTQLATAENQYGYSDYEMEIFSSPKLIVELILTIPFDTAELPYIRLIFGDQDQRFDIDSPCIPVSREHAVAVAHYNQED